jgi:hypothetical protein
MTLLSDYLLTIMSLASPFEAMSSIRFSNNRVKTPPLRNSLTKLREDQQFAVSYQRISKIFVHLAPKVILFLLDDHKNSLAQLIESINVFIWEVFDPNYLSRRSSLAQMKDALNA